MRLKNLLSSVCAASIVALSFVGCQDYDNGFTEKQLQFIQNFKEIYGEVDSTQDWNLAERAKVTVTVSKPSNIKIYAKESGRYRIVGDYKDVSGTRTLGFDVVEGTKDIMVSDGRTAQYTTVGGSVTFSGTRLILTENDDEKVTIGKTDEYRVIPKEDFARWRLRIPEGEFNIGKVSDDFVYVSTGEFTIYPVYWNTSDYDELGVYYYDYSDDNTENDREPQYVAIYKIKAVREGDDWEIVDNGNGTSAVPNYKDLTEEEEAKRKGTGELQVKYWDYSDWQDVANSSEPYSFGYNNEGVLISPIQLQAKGIKVKLELGMVFGMYIKTQGGKIFHSNKLRNTDPGDSGEFNPDGTYKKGADETRNAIHGATFIDGGHMFLGFEDWTNEFGESDFDLNDCVFMFGDDVPDVLDLTAEKWIISAEDLGNTHDIDYNDVVIEVEHTSGQEEAYVTPLAAGGTLASFVYFTDDKGNDFAVGSDIKGSNGEYKTGEIHELFSHEYATEISGDYTPINVWKATPDIYSKREYPIKVGENWSLASNVSDYEVRDENDKVIDSFDPDKAKSMGGFNIRVIKQGEAVPKNVDVVDGRVQKIQNATDPKDPNVPYVICTPKYWTRKDKSLTGHYRWPRENIPMLPTKGWGDKAAYHSEGHTFQAWVADKNEAKDWYKYPTGDNEDLTTAPTKLGVNPEASLEESIGGGTGGGDPTEPGGPSEKKGEDLYFQIQRGSDWLYLANSTLFSNDIDLSISQDFFKKDDVIYIYIRNKNAQSFTRSDVTAKYNGEDVAYGTGFDNKDFKITITQEGIQTITLYASGFEDEDSGTLYGERTITIKFTVESDGNSTGNSINISLDNITSGQTRTVQCDLYGNGTMSEQTIKGSFISFENFTIPADYDAGTLTVVCENKPNHIVVWAYGQVTYADSKGYEDQSFSISLTKEELQEVIDQGGIFIGVAFFDDGQTPIVPTSVTLNY